jgi:hypothetical protein
MSLKRRIIVMMVLMGSTPWFSGIIWMVGRVVADPSLGLPSLCGVVPWVPVLINHQMLIEGLSKIIKPMNKLLGKDKKFKWTLACEASF